MGIGVGPGVLSGGALGVMNYYRGKDDQAAQDRQKTMDQRTIRRQDESDAQSRDLHALQREGLQRQNDESSYQASMRNALREYVIKGDAWSVSESFNKTNPAGSRFFAKNTGQRNEKGEEMIQIWDESGLNEVQPESEFIKMVDGLRMDPYIIRKEQEKERKAIDSGKVEHQRAVELQRLRNKGSLRVQESRNEAAKKTARAKALNKGSVFDLTTPAGRLAKRRSEILDSIVKNETPTDDLTGEKSIDWNKVYKEADRRARIELGMDPQQASALGASWPPSSMDKHMRTDESGNKYVRYGDQWYKVEKR